MIIRLYHVVSISTSLFAPSGWHLLDLCLQKFKGWSMLVVNVYCRFSRDQRSKYSKWKRPFEICSCHSHSMSFHVIAPYCTCFLLALSHEEKVTLKETNLSEIEWNWWCSRWFNGFSFLVLIWFNSSSLSFHNLLISLEANVDWKEPLPGQIRPDPPDELIMTKPLVDADGKVYGDFGHADRMHSLHCLSKSVKICQAACHFFLRLLWVDLSR